jgi:simple sugar transport system permease protein
MLRDLFDISILQSMLRMATPVMLAAMGALVTGAAGIINIALEGMMLLAAFFAVVGSYYFGSVWAGVLVALLSGVVISTLFGIFSLKFRAHIILMGVAINAFAVALTVYLLRAMFNVAGAFSDPGIVGFKAIHIPIIKDIPVIGDLLSGYTPIVYITWFLIIAMHIMLYKTPLGVHLRAVGENPEATRTLGINVRAIRYFAVILSGVFSSLAGAYLSLGQLTMFTENMSANRGFMGLAANIFGMGTPFGAALASMLFGFADALAMRLQGWESIPSQFVLMLPAVLTIFILLYVAIRKRVLLKRIKTKNVESAISS